MNNGKRYKSIFDILNTTTENIILIHASQIFLDISKVNIICHRNVIWINKKVCFFCANIFWLSCSHVANKMLDSLPLELCFRISCYELLSKKYSNNLDCSFIKYIRQKAETSANKNSHAGSLWPWHDSSKNC